MRLRLSIAELIRRITALMGHIRPIPFRSRFLFFSQAFMAGPMLMKGVISSFAMAGAVTIPTTSDCFIDSWKLLLVSSVPRV
ncbi:hypothetical protein [Streptomyces sp. NPDC102283]|uniref:hypothetical protein n=1 Tax=Streptomyces sp. NPDC102283 TaxID=3366155 RepID=UPI00382D55A4